MPSYKDQSNKLYYIDSLEFENLLPAGCVHITDTEAEVIRQAELAAIPTPQITIVTMRQARLALLQAGKLADVAPAIAALPSPQKEAAQIEWEYSQTVERHRPFVVSIGSALGLTNAQLDDLFTLAATL